MLNGGVRFDPVWIRAEGAWRGAAPVGADRHAARLEALPRLHVAGDRPRGRSASCADAAGADRQASGATASDGHAQRAGERGRGVGAQLVDAAGALASGAGNGELLVEVEPQNGRGRNFFEGLGFEITGERRGTLAVLSKSPSAAISLAVASSP